MQPWTLYGAFAKTMRRGIRQTERGVASTRVKHIETGLHLVVRSSQAGTEMIELKGGTQSVRRGRGPIAPDCAKSSKTRNDGISARWNARVHPRKQDSKSAGTEETI